MVAYHETGNSSTVSRMSSFPYKNPCNNPTNHLVEIPLSFILFLQNLQEVL